MPFLEEGVEFMAFVRDEAPEYRHVAEWLWMRTNHAALLNQMIKHAIARLLQEGGFSTDELNDIMEDVAKDMELVLEWCEDDKFGEA